MALVAFEAEQAFSKKARCREVFAGGSEQEKMVSLLGRETWRKWGRKSHGFAIFCTEHSGQLALLSTARQEVVQQHEEAGLQALKREKSQSPARKKRAEGVGRLLGRGEMG